MDPKPELSEAVKEEITNRQRQIATLMAREGEAKERALPTLAQLAAEIRRLEGHHDDPRDAEIARLCLVVVKLEKALDKAKAKAKAKAGESGAGQ